VKEKMRNWNWNIRC